MKKKKALYWTILMAGILGILDFAFLRLAGVSLNVGTLFPGIVGIIMVLIGYIKLYTHYNFFKRRLSLRVFAIIMGLFFANFLLIETMIWTSAVSEKNVKPEVLILLGAGLQGNRIPATLQFRLEKAENYLKENQSSVVIVSGGQGIGETVTEAFAMKKWLVENGIREDRIWTENKATSTFENLLYSKKLLDERYGFKKHEVLIVTSDFHVFRSKLLGDRVGMKAYGLAAPTWWGVFPNCCIREYFGVIKSLVLDR